MNTIDVDVAVIGAGSAGLAAYRAAQLHGGRVVLIEGGAYGTTCARVGCMPSKLLIAAAEAAHAVAQAPGFGVHAGPLRIDGIQVMARVRAERDRFVGFVLEGVEKIAAADRLHGHAHFVNPQCLQVDEHTRVNAARVVIATGSRPLVPVDMQHLGDRLVVNDELFSWNDLPDSVAVFGTGVIGLELGQALHRLGTRVVLFGRGDNLAQLSDPVVRKVAQACLGAELDLRLKATIVSTERDGDAVLVHSRLADGSERRERFSYVLAAVGRLPNTDRLDLHQAGLDLDSRGVPLFDPNTMQCGSSTVFIAGDVNAERPLLHEAVDQGRIAGDNAGSYPVVTAGLRRSPLSVAFSDPQIVVAGQSFKQLKPGTFATGEISFEDQGRSRVMRQNHGMLRVYGETGTGFFLGAEMFGPRAEHIAHLLAWAHQNRMTVAQMLTMPFYHPVIEEGLRTALRDLNEKLLHSISAIEHCADCTPGT
ncbi:MAG: dihydrolipoyl dehydrogenase [Herminiimonas sp.]|nr:dihydrolipoyl dehydrogenase [Herminiimonas sp.]